MWNARRSVGLSEQAGVVVMVDKIQFRLLVLLVRLTHRYWLLLFFWYERGK
jgi:hypothetical protein